MIICQKQYRNRYNHLDHFDLKRSEKLKSHEKDSSVKDAAVDDGWALNYISNATTGSESINSLSCGAEESVIRAGSTHIVTNVTCKNMQHLNAELLQYCSIQITSSCS